MRRASRFLGAAAAAAVVVLCLPGGPASAHASLESSTPPSGAVLEQGPPQIVLDFSEPVDAALGGVELTSSSGDAVDIPDAGQGDDGDPSTIVVDGVPALEDGIYVVVWEVTSADGHPARGAFTFQVGTASAADSDALVAAALEGRDATTTVRWLYGTARFLGFVLLSVLVGVTMLGIAAGRDLGSRARLTVRWATALLALVSLSVIALHGAYVTGGALGDVLDTTLWGDVASTRLGNAVLVRLVLLAAVAAVLRWRRALNVAFPLLAVGLALTYSMTGHPSASSPAALGVALDTVHLLSVALWLGGLVGLVVARPADDAEADVLAARFSLTATVCVPLIVITGGWQTWHLLGDLSDLTTTTWGKLLLIKVCLAVIVITLGGVSRWLLRHEGAGAIRRLVVTEILVGTLVLGVTAGLVATPPAPPAPSRPFSASLVQAGVIAEVTVTPGQVGSNEVHVVLSPPGGSLQQVVSAEARISLPSADLPAVPVMLEKTGPNHYVGTVQIPEPGDWKLDLIVEPQDNSTLLMSTTVPVPG